MIKKIELQKIMDALMLRYWGIFSIDQTYRETISRANYFQVSNSILNLEAHDHNPGGEKTVIAIAVPYALEGSDPLHKKNMAKIEAFGWDFDYHVQIKTLLNQIRLDIESLYGQALVNVTICVDTSPYNDREVGFYAGLGRIGNNHLLIHKHLGSNFFIGYIVIHQNVPIESSALVKPEHLSSNILHPHCERCGKCIIACPSCVCGSKDVDMKQCLSAQTQSKEGLSEGMRIAMHDRLYGCSICQVVCPLNQNTIAHPLLTLQTSNWLDALALLELTNLDFKRMYGHMGFTWRPLWIYKRNALIVLGNIGDQTALDALRRLSTLQENEQLTNYYVWATNKIESRNYE